MPEKTHLSHSIKESSFQINCKTSIKTEARGKCSKLYASEWAGLSDAIAEKSNSRFSLNIFHGRK